MKKKQLLLVSVIFAIFVVNFFPTFSLGVTSTQTITGKHLVQYKVKKNTFADLAYEEIKVSWTTYESSTLNYIVSYTTGTTYGSYKLVYTTGWRLSVYGIDVPVVHYTDGYIDYVRYHYTIKVISTATSTNYIKMECYVTIYNDGSHVVSVGHVFSGTLVQDDYTFWSS